MVQPTRPVYGNISLAVEQQASGINACSCADLAHVVKSVEGGAVSRLPYFEALPHFQELLGLEVIGGV